MQHVTKSNLYYRIPNFAWYTEFAMRYRRDPYEAGRSALWNHGGWERYRNLLEYKRKRYGVELEHPFHDKITMSYEEASRKELIPEFHEGEIYSKRQLEWMANDLIFKDPEWSPKWGILSPDMYKRRKKREIYTGLGAPDPSIVSGLYWRTHPQGRKVSTDEQRKKYGASYYVD